MKSRNLSSEGLRSHSEALYSLLIKPVIKSTPAWCSFHNDLEQLAACLQSYLKFLSSKNEDINQNHNLQHLVRPVGEYTTVEHRKNCRPETLKGRYELLDRAVRSGGESSFIFFEEDKYLSTPFESNQQRYKYFTELALTVPIDIYRYCPGGSIVASYCIVFSKESRSEQELLIEGARFVLRNKNHFKEYHTRAMKRSFKEKINNISKISPSVLDLIYKELTLDAATAAHPDIQERLCLISLGETDLIADLRHLNPGRPNKFDEYFQHLAAVVEESTAADERRHGTAHLSEWLSLGDMMKRAEERCPENTLIPSKSLVRLQFAPRNPYARTAWNFTSKIEVQYKIQRRQLRMSHPDEHYCNALLKYLKERAIDLNSLDDVNVGFFSCDDKAKVPIGEPGFAVSTGVRGKQTIAPTSTTLVAGDQDMTKSSLTPSVTLDIKIPSNVEESFVRGKVSVTVNDSVFQSSNAVSLSRLLHERHVNVLLKYTDGGVDHRNTLEAVKCAAICLFKEHNLDMLVLCRCAPGHSWRNPAERVMSILNLGLQNCSLEREKVNEDDEKLLKKCGSMSEIRQMAMKEPHLKESYQESVEKVQATIQKRFRRLKLKDEPIVTADPVKDDEIDLFKV